MKPKIKIGDRVQFRHDDELRSIAYSLYGHTADSSCSHCHNIVNSSELYVEAEDGYDEWSIIDKHDNRLLHNVNGNLLDIRNEFHCLKEGDKIEIYCDGEIIIDSVVYCRGLFDTLNFAWFDSSGRYYNDPQNETRAIRKHKEG